MPSNRTSNDIDLVQPTQYKVPPSRVAEKPPPKPWELTDFEPLHIDDFDDYGTPNLSQKAKGRRKPLSELSTNTVKKCRDSKDWKRPQQTPRTRYGCSVCQIPFCREDDC